MQYFFKALRARASSETRLQNSNVFHFQNFDFAIDPLWNCMFIENKTFIPVGQLNHCVAQSILEKVNCW